MSSDTPCLIKRYLNYPRGSRYWSNLSIATSGPLRVAITLSRQGTRSTSQVSPGCEDQTFKAFPLRTEATVDDIPRSTDVTIPTWGTAGGCMTPSGLNHIP
jgi:hypothetical protein